MKRMWLDDIRPAPVGWYWVKTAAEAIAMLKTGRVIEASLDHDLAEEHYLQQERGEGDYSLAPSAPTGYSVVCWMEEHNVWPAEGTHVHSLNPVGAARMRAAIDRARGLG